MGNRASKRRKQNKAVVLPPNHKAVEKKEQETIAPYEYQHHRYRVATEAYIHLIGKTLDQVIPEIIIEICYQFFILENIMFQVEAINPDHYKSERVRLRHFYDDYLYASIFNPCSVNAYCDLNESYTPPSE